MQPSMVQYLGFEQNQGARTCLFRVFGVVDAQKHERWFRMSVTMPSLKDNRFKLQDLPDLCSSKLKRELSFETELQTLPAQMSIADCELKQYNDEHYPKRGKSGGDSRAAS